MGEFARLYKAELNDIQLANIWSVFCQTGRQEAVNYNRPPMDIDGFLSFVRRPDIYWWLVTFRERLGGMVWLSNKEGKTAHVHFTQFPLGTQRTEGRLPASVAIGLYGLANILWTGTPNGWFLHRCLGLTPSTNRKAIHFAQKIGGKVLATIPGACFLWKEGQNVDGVWTEFTRDNISRNNVNL